MRAYFTLQVGHARVAYLKRVFVKYFLQRVALWERILHNAQEFLSHVGLHVLAELGRIVPGYVSSPVPSVAWLFVGCFTEF